MSDVKTSLTDNAYGEPISNVVSKEDLRRHQIKVMNHLDKVVSCTYGPMSSNTLDIISQMSQVGKIHKLINNDSKFIFKA